MQTLEDIFNELLTTSFNELDYIEVNYYQGRTKIEEMISKRSIIEPKTVIFLSDYNALICGKSLYHLLKRLLYCNNMTSSIYRSFIGEMISFDRKVVSLNTLDKELWDQYIPVNSGVLIELKKMTLKLEEALVSECLDNNDIIMTNILDNSFKTRLIELGAMLISQLNMIRIATVNSIIEGPTSEFRDILKEYLKWTVTVSSNIIQD